MRVLYIHQYFKTPEESGVLRSYHLARGLVKAGHEVEMITAHNLPYSETKTIQGINVHYLPVPYSNQMGFGSRVAAFVRFAWLGSLVASNIKKVDLCYCTSTPLTVGLIALYLKWRFGIRYIFEIRDLWPEAPIQLGFISNPILKALLYAFEKILYRHSEKVVSLSSGTTGYLNLKVPETEIQEIPNMADCEFFTRQVKSPGLLTEFKIQAKFVISYLGTLGQANRVGSIVDLASACRDQSVQILVAGEGKYTEDLLREIEERNIGNLRFLGFRAQESVGQILNISDAVLVSFQEAPILQFNSPNKLFDGLAAGKMIIVNVDGWIRQLVEEYQFGFYWSGSDPTELLYNLDPYLQDPDLLLKTQLNARNLAESKFSKRRLVQKLVDTVESTKPRDISTKAYTSTT